MNNLSQTAQAKKSQYRHLLLLALMVLSLLIMLVWIFSGHSTHTKKSLDKIKFSRPLDNIDAEPVVLERIQKALENTQKQALALKNQMDQQLKSVQESKDDIQKKYDDRLAVLEKKFSDNSSLQNQMNSTNTDTSSYESNNRVVSGSANYHDRIVSMSENDPKRRASTFSEESMREDKIPLSSPDTDLPIAIRNPNSYVPAGTFVKAVMLGGADTAASVASSSNPEVMLFRVIEEGTLPNHKKSHLKGCIALASVYGDISSERGMIRVENLSCVFPNDEVMDQKVHGSVFGPEGKYGVRGKPLWRETALLERAFAAGTLSGLSTGLSQTYTTNSISADGNVQSINPSKIFQYGAASGAGKAMDKLAEYNIKRAEQYHPVIQLSAGTVVDIVFQEGFFLDGKKHDHEEAAPRPVTQFFKKKTVPISNAAFPSVDSHFSDGDVEANADATLPLTDEQIKKIQENSKELGFTVRGDMS